MAQLSFIGYRSPSMGKVRGVLYRRDSVNQLKKKSYCQEKGKKMNLR